MVIKVPRFRNENGFITDPQRSRLMSKIKGINSKPEIELRKELWNRGVRYRKNFKKLSGCPDLVIMKKRLQFLLMVNFGTDMIGLTRKKRLKRTVNSGSLK